MPHGGARATLLFDESGQSVQQAQTPQEVKILSGVISGADGYGPQSRHLHSVFIYTLVTTVLPLGNGGKSLLLDQR
jgi:hypothetical protein